MNEKEPEYVLEMKNISKHFGQLVANKSINLTLKKGEVHAILGENWAGKSTLMKILYGEYKPTQGKIFIKGNLTEIKSPYDAIKKGIGMVHQHFMLVDTLSVLDNLLLGKEKTLLGFIQKNYHRNQLKRLIDQYAFDIDLDASVASISVSMQQKVEILKTLYHGAEIIILDEPSAVLTPQEVHSLSLIVKRLISEGKSILLITHKMHEIKDMASRCTILRRGEVVKTVDVSRVSEKDLAFMMVGRMVSFDFPKSSFQNQSTLLEIKDLSLRNERSVQKLKQISLFLNKGEILGIAGVDGSGQTELIKSLVGLEPYYEGDIFFQGVSLKSKSPREIFELGLASIPEDRHKEGLILDFDLKNNLAIRSYDRQPFSHKGILDVKSMREHAEKSIQAFDIRPASTDLKAKHFSGGNQQKIIIAREVSSNPQVILAAHPTRGLDLGAIQYIYQSLIAQRDQGKGILLFSFELDELISICDRIAVIFQGEIVDILNKEEATEQRIGVLMMGKVNAREEGYCGP